MRVHLSHVFLIVNIAILFLGTYYWIVRSTFRIMILYSLFSFILFWLTNRHQHEVSPTTRLVSRSIASWCGVSAAILSVFLIVATLESLYTRPPETSAFVAAILVLLIVVLMSDKVGATFVRRPVFLLIILTFVVLYMGYSVYLVQPDLMHGPAYASVDAYRDYANAMRIVSLSHFEPEKMIFTPYYRTFPVVPLEIVTVATVTGLPVNIGHLIVGAVFVILGVSCAVLLSRVVMGKRRDAQLLAAAFLPALVVLVNPQLTDPSLFYLEPLGFGVFLLLLVMYLAFRSINSDRRWSISAYVSIVLITLVMVPMHASSTAMMIILFTAIVLSMKRRSIFVGLAVISIVVFLLYLISYTGSPTGLFAVIFDYLNREYLTIIKTQQAGASVLNVLAARTSGSQWDEVSSFLGAVPQAFFLAIASIMIVRLTEDRNDIKRGSTMPRVDARSICEDLGSFCLFCGLLFIVTFGGAYVLTALGSGVLARYFVYALTPIMLLATTVILVLKLKNMNTARRLLLLGLLVFYVISVATSPYFLMERSPNGVRMVPIQSERAAASFLSDKYEIDQAGTEIVSDYPFVAHVAGVLLSEHYDEHVFFPDLIHGPMLTGGHRTFILLRQYFIRNQNLQRLGSGGYEIPLTDSQKWIMDPSFNRIFDDSSTCIYSGTL